MLLYLQQAIEANSYYDSFEPLRTLQKGDTAAGYKSADHIQEGQQHVGGQDHFYLETQACIAVPKGEDDEMEVFISCQGTDMPQVRRM